jgi:hypothetical protein
MFSIWPLSPLTALVLVVAVVPSHYYVNRGFTQWFHWVGLYYALTQWEFLERFQILSGCSVCLGWYASLIYEYVIHGRFCHPLYKNMPTILMKYYLVEVSRNNLNDDDDPYATNNSQPAQQLDFESKEALIALTVAHILDLLAHPLLTYYFWRKYAKRGGSFKEVFTWPVILMAYLYSRLWSLTHTKYNTGKFGLWCFGFDIYVMDSLDSWYPAYITESCVYASLVTWKLYDKVISKIKQHSTPRQQPTIYEATPKLIFSDSSVSIESASG